MPINFGGSALKIASNLTGDVAGEDFFLIQNIIHTYIHDLPLSKLEENEKVGDV